MSETSRGVEVGHTNRRRARAVGAASALLLAIGCQSIPYEPERATDPYPRALHRADAPVDIQVFRRGETIRVVNATTTSYTDVRLWLNQRYVRDMESIPAGAIVNVPLRDFWDVWGGRPNPGGIFRRFEPTPIRMAQLQIDDETPLIGLVMIRAERAD